MRIDEKAVLFLVSAGLIACPLFAADENERAALPAKRLAVPVSRGRLSLTDALMAAGFAMRTHYLTYGIELADPDYPVEPAVSVEAGAGTSVREYLNDIFQQAPGYEYEAVSGHLLAVYPRGANAMRRCERFRMPLPSLRKPRAATVTMMHRTAGFTGPEMRREPGRRIGA